MSNYTGREKDRQSKRIDAITKKDFYYYTNSVSHLLSVFFGVIFGVTVANPESVCPRATVATHVAHHYQHDTN